MQPGSGGQRTGPPIARHAGTTVARAYLKIRDKQFPLDKTITVIGRDHSCDVSMEDELLSKKHALIVRDGDRYLVYDFKSANGVFVDSRQVEVAQLRDGQLVTVGGQTLAFNQSPEEETESGTAPQPTPAAGTALTPAGGTGAPDELFRKSIEKNISDLLRDKTINREEAYSKLLILYKVSSIINRVLDTDELLNRIIDLALEVMTADRGFIMLKDSKGELVPMVSRSVDRGAGKEHILPISQSIARHTFTTGEAVLSNDAMFDRRFQSSGSVQLYNIRSAMCVPLEHQEQRLGVLYVDNRMSSNSFSSSDVILLKAFAEQVSIAITNSQLYKSLRDSLERIQAQQQMLVQSEKMAAMGMLAAGVAHEIRNPLTAISGYVQMFFARSEESTHFYQQMKVIRQAVAQIQNVLEGLLGFSRRRETRIEPGPVNQVVEDTLALAQHAIGRGGKVSVKKHLGDDLPPVMMDQRQIQQVVLNFVLNAVQAMPEGGTLAVTTQLSPGGDDGSPGPGRVEVIIADTGVGIPAEKQAMIFQPFYTGKKDGTGLGLTISKQIVEGHKGHISFESVEGKGTRFVLSFPAVARPAGSTSA